ncbi:MAG TPA: cytochrome c oxidase subunit 3 [Candidatus Acidoferrales bacterium]|nr:cytochrome c oxidase subunit 3 [Candidatus Acidoferrales bacterium]
MPGAVAEQIEIQVQRGHGGGLPPDGNSGGGGGDGRRNPIPRRAYITAITIGLGGILMFFMALTSSYIVRRGLGNDWQNFALPRILWVNTVILLASSATLELARKALSRGQNEAFRNLWLLTTGLGLVFVGGQLAAWRQLHAAGVFLATNPSSSFFYLFTAAHGLHLLGGVIALLYVAFRSWRKSRTTQTIAAEVAGIYWHFLDGLWVFLLLLFTLGR